MAKKNFFKINRRLLNHPLWLEESFTKGQAWVDLIGSANYKDGYFMKKGQRVDVKRGQSGTSMLTFSRRWKWSRGKVKRFFNLLEKEQMIRQENGHLTTLTTICNYELYQAKTKGDGTPDGTPDGHLTDIRRTSDGTHPRRIKEESKEGKEESEETNPPNPPLTDEPFFGDQEEDPDGRLELQNAFDDCRSILGLSDTEIKEFYSRHSESNRFAEAVQFTVEKTEKDGKALEKPLGFMDWAYKNGKTSLRTREKACKPRNGERREKEEENLVIGAPEGWITVQ